MRIAYLILAHKNPKQLARLLNLLHNDVYVHIDKKCNLDEFYIKSEKVNFIKERVSIKWGGFSMIDATLKLIKTAREKDNYDFYILLSGDDYPIKNLNEFESFLKSHKNYSFMEYDKFDEKWAHSKRRYEKYWISGTPNIPIKILQKLLNLFIKKRPMYKNMEAYKGSQWWCLGSECIQYLVKYIENNRDVISYFKHTQIPDEMFFQTILLNSNLRNKIINDNLRYILLEGAHPETLTKKDFQNITKLQDKFFARKFDISVDKEIFDLLDDAMNLGGSKVQV